MVGNQTETGELLSSELEAYLDRELSARPAPEVKPSAGVAAPADSLQSVLALAAEEEQWLRTLPAPELPPENSKDLEDAACAIPEHLKPKPPLEVELAPPVEPPPPQISWMPPPAPLPGLEAVPAGTQPEWDVPVAPVPVEAPAPAEPRRMQGVVTGALVGVSAASLLVAGVLWVVRDGMPSRAREPVASVPASTVTTAPPPSLVRAHKPEPIVKESPPPRQPQPPPAPANPEHSVASHEAQPPVPVPSPAPKVAPPVVHAPPPLVATVKTETVKPREKVQPRRAAAAQVHQTRRDVEDPSLDDAEEETPFTQQPAVARAQAPAAKAAPEPGDASEQGEYDEFDKDFARELGFTKDSVKKEPERKGVKSVWIPPDPSQEVPESLTPADIQKVVVAHQPEVVSCIRQNQEALSGMNGGKFMMRWFIAPDGSTYGVAMETQALRGSALATCIEGLVKDWKFPRHRAQMGPIRFPFVF